MRRSTGLSPLHQPTTSRPTGLISPSGHGFPGGILEDTWKKALGMAALTVEEIISPSAERQMQLVLII